MRAASGQQPIRLKVTEVVNIQCEGGAGKRKARRRQREEEKKARLLKTLGPDNRAKPPPTTGCHQWLNRTFSMSEIRVLAR